MPPGQRKAAFDARVAERLPAWHQRYLDERAGIDAAWRLERAAQKNRTVCEQERREEERRDAAGVRLSQLAPGG